MIRDGNAVGITTEVVEHILGTTEGWLGVDDPMFSKQWPEPRGEDLRLSEWCQIAGKVQLPLLKSRLELVDELSAKYTPQHVDGEKESRVRPNPAGVIAGETTRWDDAVDMVMKLELQTSPAISSQTSTSPNPRPPTTKSPFGGATPLTTMSRS